MRVFCVPCLRPACVLCARCIETYDDESMLQTSGSLVPPMHHDQPKWVLGRKGELMVKVLVEILYELQAELIVQASFGGLGAAQTCMSRTSCSGRR